MLIPPEKPVTVSTVVNVVVAPPETPVIVTVSVCCDPGAGTVSVTVVAGTPESDELLWVHGEELHLLVLVTTVMLVTSVVRIEVDVDVDVEVDVDVDVVVVLLIEVLLDTTGTPHSTRSCPCGM